MPDMIQLKPVSRFNVRVRNTETVLLAIGTTEGDSVQIPTKSPADSEMMSPGDTR